MRCLIVDDDPLICDLLEHFCSKVDAITELTTTNSGFESVNLLSQHTFDLVLLDYDLPDMSGKEILEIISKDTAVIMITSHKDFASESYDYEQIVDFLVKPIEFPRFFKGIQKVTQKLPTPAPENKQLFIKDGTQLIKVELDKVLFIKSAGNYAELYFEDRKVMTLMTLKELEQKLPSHFQRVHRSCIVNINHIESISNNDIHIKGEEIAISSSYEKELMKKISLLN
ncbi:LytR/AlgR family response regulator transcription factor [Reichenbachiella ulvae]|uniref:LytTR family DNA-binding domain-containing protein n=1 Tax=Reichenbachiella ulvae TaxID=2980104 RepID=A0ABT3CPB8_9BACT|nr:LytTR family DNA-binding domain-containing protein [Reichenbachiella ulvae]MCV9385536.1 LytTR family DNA-binding domain-containing protein [Reichenbachiella ulvae]